MLERIKPTPILWLNLWLERADGMHMVSFTMATRARNKLTARQVATISKVGIYSDGGGLYLRVRASGRSWFFIGQLYGKRREMGLGNVHDVTLAQAREKAAAARALILEGRDPVAERDKAVVPPPVVVTFGKFAMEHLDEIEDGFRNAKHRQQWRNTLKTYAASIWEVPIDEITTDQILDLLKPIWLGKPESASRVRGRVERILDAAKVKGLRDGENPARWKGHLKLLLPTQSKNRVKHHPALPFAGIAAFMKELRARTAMAARALEFTILTAARSGETRGMTWAEVDMKEKIWTVPAERMKSRVIHVVPLSDAAMSALRAAKPDVVQPSAFVFPAPRGGKLSDMSLSMLLRRMGRTDITVHGFRSTFRDWAGDATNFGHEEIEMSLAHTIASATERSEASRVFRRLLSVRRSYDERYKEQVFA